jgi:hypothetical protein
LTVHLTPTGSWDWATYYAAHGIVPAPAKSAAARDAERLASDAALADRLARRLGCDPASALRRYERARERYWAAE